MHITEREEVEMTKRQLVVRISKETGIIQQDVFAVVQKFLDYVVEGLADGKHMEFRDFGVFEVKQRQSRIGRNPNAPGTTIQIPPRKVVKFKPGKKMRETILSS